jgi:hypothetical protein
VREAERLNKALRVGRTPGLLVSILEMLEQHGLAQHFTVVGTHALYAYEAAAGVRIEAGALATHDVDMLWDAGKHVRFYADIQRLDTSMLKLLQKVDSSFRRKDHELSSAINSKGFEVDFLRREQQGNDPHPIQLSKDPNDLFVVQARRANILTQASTFEQVVASATGKMAMMRTIDPGVFVSFKEWMSTEAPDRPQPKRRRDALQARVVRQLLEEQLLIAS